MSHDQAVEPVPGTSRFTVKHTAWNHGQAGWAGGGPGDRLCKIWRAFREKSARQASPEQVTVRLHHKPAEKTQIDFSDGLWITEPLTGNKRLTQFFLGVLPFSFYTFGEFVLDQKLSTFIAVQERMFAYFGGVTPYLVVDNLKSGVQKPDLYDPDVNPTYCDYVLFEIMRS